jgi:cytochrome c oxidase subunit II
MPPPVRKRLVFVVTCVLALLFAHTALAGNGGIAPPEPHSPNAHRITDSYWLILAVTAAIFFLVEGALIVFVVRFRSRGRARDAEGPQIHGATRLEIIWTAISLAILVVIAGFVLYKLPGIKNVPAARAGEEQVRIKVDAHQFYWQFDYGNGVVSIDELRVPVGRVVRLDIVSHDVDHSWWIPEFGGKFDAIPGQTNHTWFEADKPGVYRGQCGEFCGIFHAAMQARVVATSFADFKDWLASRHGAELGRNEFTGVCAKCHGFKGEGGYGPPLQSSAILKQRQGLYTIVAQGGKKMPPVGKGWTDEQLSELYDYVSTKVFTGGAAGGSAR